MVRMFRSVVNTLMYLYRGRPSHDFLKHVSIDCLQISLEQIRTVLSLLLGVLIRGI